MKNTKNTFIFSFIILFLAVPILGFVAMHHDGEHGNCAMVTAKGFDCPSSLNSFDMAIFHLDLSKFFSSAVFSANILNYIFIYVGLMFFVGLLVLHDPYLIKPFVVYRHRQLFELNSAQFRQRLLYWFSLHENSPATLLGR